MASSSIRSGDLSLKYLTSGSLLDYALTLPDGSFIYRTTPDVTDTPIAGDYYMGYILSATGKISIIAFNMSNASVSMNQRKTNSAWNGWKSFSLS